MSGQAGDQAGARTVEKVELAIPASVDLVVLARFTAATVAARAGFDVDEIEDLRLAVDELCVSFGPIERHSGVRLQFERIDDTVRITGEFGRAEPSEAAGLEGAAEQGVSDDLTNSRRAEILSRQLLEALVDDHALVENDGHRIAWLEKRRGSDIA